MKGAELLKYITQSTGLPEYLIEKEVALLVSKTGLKREDITLDDIRHILVEYLQEVIVKAKEEMSSSGL